VSVGVLATLLLAVGAVQAAKPGLAAGLGYNASTVFSDVVTLPSGDVDTTIAELVLPVNGKFMVSATVTVSNRDTTGAADVLCKLTHGDGVIDLVGQKLGPATDAGNTADRFALSGALVRDADAGGINLDLVCSSTQGADVSDANLNAISVSSLSVQ